MPAAGMVAGIVRMGSGKVCPTRPAWVRIMKPNLFDRTVLWSRKRLLIPIHDWGVRIADDGGVIAVVIVSIVVAFIVGCGCPVMLWIHCRGLTMFLEDDDHQRTYPCIRIPGTTGIDWKKEGF